MIMQQTLNLPRPDEDALAHSKKLQALICAEIVEQAAPMSFARYMELCLYAPGLGYYVAGMPKFGHGGDFVTAPELGPLFGRCMARQCAEVLRLLDGGDVLELGAGTGKLAVNVLQHLAELDQLPQHYYILEPSPELRERQAATIAAELPESASIVTWLPDWPQAPIQGVIIANEVLDAMPVHVFQLQGKKLQECAVSQISGELQWQSIDASELVKQRVTALQQQGFLNHAQDYQSEVCSLLPGWLQSLADSLSAGAAIFCDYGFPAREYYHADRHMGTVMCHYRHRAHTNSLLWPGLQDITAHVDFSYVAYAAEQAGCRLLGYTSQANYLLALGAADFDLTEDPVLKQALLTLTMPHEMGELFKVMAVGKNFDCSLTGFSLRDRSRAL